MVDAQAAGEATGAARRGPSRLRRAVLMPMQAERPVILAGGGVVLAEGSEDLVQLAERTGAAAVVTYTGKGCFPEDHQFSTRGTVAQTGTILGNQACREADAFLAVGCRFADGATSSYVPGETF